MNDPRSHALRSALCLALAVLAGCSAGGREAPAERPTPLVEAVAARAGTLPLTETVNGVVKARNQVEVRPEIAAPVAEVLAESGDAVERGQVLVRLKDDEARDRLNQAAAEIMRPDAVGDHSREEGVRR